MRVSGQHHAPAALPPGKTWYPLYRRLVGLRASLDRCGKSRTHQDSIPWPSSPQQVTMPIELSQLQSSVGLMVYCGLLVLKGISVSQMSVTSKKDVYTNSDFQSSLLCVSYTQLADDICVFVSDLKLRQINVSQQQVQNPYLSNFLFNCIHFFTQQQCFLVENLSVSHYSRQTLKYL